MLTMISCHCSLNDNIDNLDCVFKSLKLQQNVHQKQKYSFVELIQAVRERKVKPVTALQHKAAYWYLVILCCVLMYMSVIGF